MSRPSPTHLLAIDGGGTGCRGALLDRASGRRFDAVEGPANVSDFAGAIARIRAVAGDLFRQAGLQAGAGRAVAAHVGLAGVIATAGADAVAGALDFGRLRVTSDQPTMIVGALGDRDGAVAAIGTGSFVGAQAAGAVRFLGGWGFAIGDQASGAWLGREIMIRAALAADGVAPGTDLISEILAEHGGVAGLTRFSLTARPADYARYAPAILRAAEAGDAAGMALMRRGADYISDALAALGWTAGQRLCLTGGLGPAYARWLPEAVTAHLAKPDGTALDGALTLAGRLAEEAA